MLPTASDLDDPDGFVHHEQLDFSELDRMLGDAAEGAAGKPDLKKKDADDSASDESGGEATGEAKGDTEGDSEGDGKDDTDK